MLPPGGIWRRSHRACVEGTFAPERRAGPAPMLGNREAPSMERLTAEKRCCASPSSCAATARTGPGRCGRCGSSPGSRSGRSACSPAYTTPSPTASRAWPPSARSSTPPQAHPPDQRDHRRQRPSRPAPLADNLRRQAAGMGGAFSARERWPWPRGTGTRPPCSSQLAVLVKPVDPSCGRLVPAAGLRGHRRPVRRRPMGWPAGPPGPRRSRPGRPLLR